MTPAEFLRGVARELAKTPAWCVGLLLAWLALIALIVFEALT